MISRIECAQHQRPAARGRRWHRQLGQALALLLMLLAALLGGLLFVFNSGQIVAAKIRLIGAADAAAYSAAQYQARALNFQAYMNRAIVANEVAIAQSVSLRSWSGYFDQALQRAATLGTLAPPLAAPLQSLARGWTGINRGLQRTLPPVEAAVSRWNVDVLERAEVIADAQTLAVVENLARDVAIENIPELGSTGVNRLFAAANAQRWRELTMSHARTGEERARLREVVMAARDGFSLERRWTLGLPPVLSLRKRGGTDLIGYDSWRGMDTLALHVPTLFGMRELPLARNAAEDRREVALARGYHGGSYRDNPRSSRDAARALVAAVGYRGLAAYRDVRLPRSGSGATLRYELELRQPGTSIWTSDNALGGAATVIPGEAEKRVVPAYRSGEFVALSAAQVYFQRPIGRADMRQELPSLFNPYWQARLAPVTVPQRLFAAAARGGGADPYLLLP